MPCGALAGRHMFLMQHLRALFTYQALRGISDRPPRARSDIAYLNSRDATIMGSRNGHAPIYMWYTLTRKGYEGMRKDVERCLRNAHLLKARPYTTRGREKPVQTAPALRAGSQLSSGAAIVLLIKAKGLLAQPWSLLRAMGACYGCWRSCGADARAARRPGDAGARGRARDAQRAQQHRGVRAADRGGVCAQMAAGLPGAQGRGRVRGFAPGSEGLLRGSCAAPAARSLMGCQ